MRTAARAWQSGAGHGVVAKMVGSFGTLFSLHSLVLKCFFRFLCFALFWSAPPPRGKLNRCFGVSRSRIYLVQMSTAVIECTQIYSTAGAQLLSLFSAVVVVVVVESAGTFSTTTRIPRLLTV